MGVDKAQSRRIRLGTNGGFLSRKVRVSHVIYMPARERIRNPKARERNESGTVKPLLEDDGDS